MGSESRSKGRNLKYEYGESGDNSTVQVGGATAYTGCSPKDSVLWGVYAVDLPKGKK